MVDQDRTVMSHDEVLDLAPLYALRALEPEEMAAARRHLEVCREPHPELAELAGIVPILASAVEPVEPPEGLRARILDAITAPSATAPSTGAARTAAPEAALPPSRRLAAARVERPSRRSLLARLGVSWRTIVVPAAAALAVGALLVWNLQLQQQVDRVERQSQAVARAVELVAVPGARLATLRPEAGAGPTGFAVVPPQGEGYLVLRGLDAPPQGMAYQAWFVDDSGPRSAGLVELGSDGVGILTGLSGGAEGQLMAITIENAAGAVAPTSPPIASGRLVAAGSG